MSRIEQIIGEIEDFVEGAKPQMLSSTNVVVNKEELQELLVELRLAIPNEVKQYQKIISNKEAILNEAKAEAANMLAQANRETEQLLDEHEIMQKAYATSNKLIADATAQAETIVDNATSEANSIKKSMLSYTDDMLGSLQTIINHGMENAQGRFDAYMSSMQSSYDVVTQNRTDLASSNTGADDSETEE